jgi:isopenicillin N synthase-like dioxygenase
MFSSFSTIRHWVTAEVLTLGAAAGIWAQETEILPLDVIPYEAFIQEDPDAIATLKSALHTKGIVGIKGIPGFREKASRWLDVARAFNALPEEVKEAYAPNHEGGEDIFVGYEVGKENFQLPDGRWVIDNLKVSYYSFLPDSKVNKWPVEVDLKGPFQELGGLMSDVGQVIMRQIGLLGPATGITLEKAPRLGRMLYYRKSGDSNADNPYWCGAHFDHSMFTGLLPAFYFLDGQQVPEPDEAGLFVKTSFDGIFKKIVVTEADVMMFQVGEFGQLVSNDAIRATEHRVHKAKGKIERYTMALFFDAPMDTVIRSYSELTADARYGGKAGEPCTYQQWNDATFNRFLVK